MRTAASREEERGWPTQKQFIGPEEELPDEAQLLEL